MERAERVAALDAALRGRTLGLADEARGALPSDELRPLLALESPHALRRRHLTQLARGADVLRTETFHAAPARLARHGLGTFGHELNLAAAVAAREAADLWISRGTLRWVAGVLGPVTLPDGDPRPFEELVEDALVQVRALHEGGVDAFFVAAEDRTSQRAAVTATKRLFASGGEHLVVAVRGRSTGWIVPATLPGARGTPTSRLLRTGAGGA